MKKYDVYDGNLYLGSTEADDRKTAKHNFFEENKEIEAERKRQKRVKCSYSVKERKQLNS
jgi:hypothetical protein